MTETGLSPHDQEMIAAFIDRRLSPDERQAFMERLDSEEELYEVFVETVRYRDRQTGRPATVVGHPAGRHRWLQAAAVAAVVAAAVTPVVLRYLPAERYAPALVADGLLHSVLEDDWYVKGWPVTRGPGPGSDEFDTAFRLGVRQVDLEVALRLGRVEDATYIAGEIGGLLDGLALAEILELHYDEVRRLAGERERALGLAEAGDAELREFLGKAAAPYELGQWVEAGILAARGGNSELLGSRDFRRTLRGLQGHQWPELAGQLERIEGLLEAGEEELDLPRLEAALSELVDRA